MKGINQVILAGTTIGEPYVRRNHDGKVSCRITVCVERETTGGNIFKDYFNVQFFGDMAERAEKVIKDRMFVNVMGRLNKRTYNTEDEKKHVTINITGEDFLICVPSEITNAFGNSDKRKKKNESIDTNKTLEEVATEQEKAETPVEAVKEEKAPVSEENTMATIGDMIKDQNS